MLPADPAVPVVIYGAKSTDDVRGSIPTQLQDCRDAIGKLGERRVVGEFKDEAVSAFNSSRGRGLEDALRCAAEAAGRFGAASCGSSIRIGLLAGMAGRLVIWWRSRIPAATANHSGSLWRSRPHVW
jgi:hypothetical protein